MSDKSTFYDDSEFVDEFTQDLDVDDIAHVHTSDSYPCFMIKEGNDAFVAMYENLEVGSLPLKVLLNGVEKVLPKRISESAFNVDRLLKVVSPVYYYNESGKEFILNTPVDYVEAVLS